MKIHFQSDKTKETFYSIVNKKLKFLIKALIIVNSIIIFSKLFSSEDVYFSTDIVSQIDNTYNSVMEKYEKEYNVDFFILNREKLNILRRKIEIQIERLKYNYKIQLEEEMSTRIVFHSQKSKNQFMSIMKEKIKQRNLMYKFLKDVVELQKQRPLESTLFVMNSLLRSNLKYDNMIEAYILDNPDFDYGDLDIQKLKNLKTTVKKQLFDLNKVYNSLRNKKKASKSNKLQNIKANKLNEKKIIKNNNRLSKSD